MLREVSSKFDLSSRSRGVTGGQKRQRERLAGRMARVGWLVLAGWGGWCWQAGVGRLGRLVLADSGHRWS